MLNFIDKALVIKGLNKIYDNGFCALDNINLEIDRGEIFALLGPNGAGKTTLISAICGLVRPSSGVINIFGHDHIKDYKMARAYVGLVPQELTTDTFETVWNTVKFSRGLFGKEPSPDYIETILKKLSLWDKKDSQIRTLSGGMKRRVLIAKALSHEPEILFLDEPSSGVDVELRKSMWEQIRELRDSGVSIILTTHYIAEAEEMADRIGIINQGRLILVEEKKPLMQKLGRKKLVINLNIPMKEIPVALLKYNMHLEDGGSQLVFNYDPEKEENEIAELLSELKENNIKCKDINTYKSSLEEIFIQLVKAS
jgi:ABC-2 type transport system ATP-binding protein